MSFFFGELLFFSLIQLGRHVNAWALATLPAAAAYYNAIMDQQIVMHHFIHV